MTQPQPYFQHGGYCFSPFGEAYVVVSFIHASTTSFFLAFLLPITLIYLI
jgi:hypothetical protein